MSTPEKPLQIYEDWINDTFSDRFELYENIDSIFINSAVAVGADVYR